ncbi:MAG: SpoVG family protein [Eisenbergiella massiliensis]|uniref:SpoVG family protein n=1 Tax=Eisenbergiella massiliensis TaxID=1720294 RepID=UPI00399433BD
MPTVDIRITSMYPPGVQGGTRAYASATIDGCIAVRGIKIVEGGRSGLFVSMLSRKTQDGYKEMCFPVTAVFREQLHHAVLDAYQQALTQAQVPPEQQAPPAEGIPQAGQQMGSM